MEPHGFEKLGGKESSVVHPLQEGSATVGETHPITFMQESAWNAPIYYQGHRPACSAHALAFAKSVLDANDGKVNLKKSPRFSWIDIKEHGFDKNPSDGADITAIGNSGINTGVADYEPLENDVTYDDADYAAPKFITQNMLTNAGLNKLDDFTYVSPPFTFECLKQLIYDHKALIVLMRVGTSLWEDEKGNVDWSEQNVCPLRPPTAIVDGHFEVMHSYEATEIWMANSFGTTYGRNGHNSIAENYLPYIVEIGIPKNPTIAQNIVTAVQTPVAEPKPAPVATTTPQAVKPVQPVPQTPPVPVASTNTLQKLVSYLFQLLTRLFTGR